MTTAEGSHGGTAVTHQQRDGTEQRQPLGLAQLVDAAQRATASHDAEEQAPTSSSIARPEEYDVIHLVTNFLLGGHRGQSINFKAFKVAWKSMHFSNIFTAHRSSVAYDDFVNSLYDIVLNFMSSGLPTDTVKAIAAASATAAAPVQPAQPPSTSSHLPRETSNGGTEAALNPAVPMSISSEEVAWLTSLSLKELACVGVYCLYSLYKAQPGNPMIKIRIGLERQPMILDAASSLAQTGHADALTLLRDLLDSRALVPCALERPAAATSAVDDANGNVLAPGAGVMMLTPGLQGEDAATLREVRFHLDSTLTGLGTGHLDELCMRYKRHMELLWAGLVGHAEDEAPPQGVADLTLGRQLHEFAINKGLEVNKVVQRGRSVSTKAREAKEASGKNKRGNNNKKGGMASIAEAPSTAPIERNAQPLSPAITAGNPPTAHVLEEEDLQGMPAVARQILKRKVARQDDIARRAKPWAEVMGLEGANAGLPVAAAGGDGGIESDDDMPHIPGMPSEFAHLAGPSALKTLSAATETTVQDRGREERRRGKRPMRNDTTSDSSSDEEDSPSPSPSPPPPRSRKEERKNKNKSSSKLAVDHLDGENAARKAAVWASLAAQALAEDEDYDAPHNTAVADAGANGTTRRGTSSTVPKATKQKKKGEKSLLERGGTSKKTSTDYDTAVAGRRSWRGGEGSMGSMMKDVMDAIAAGEASDDDDDDNDNI